MMIETSDELPTGYLVGKFLKLFSDLVYWRFVGRMIHSHKVMFPLGVWDRTFWV